MYTGTNLNGLIELVDRTRRGSTANVVILTGAEADAAVERIAAEVEANRVAVLADLYEGNS